MHEPRRNAMRRPVAAALALTLAALVGAQLAARSGLVLREPIEGRLEGLGARAGVVVDVGRIAPSGLWGVRLNDVVIRGAGTAAPLLARIDRIDVFPALAQLLKGRLAVERIDVWDPNVDLVFAAEADGLRDWARRFSPGSASSRTRAEAPAGSLLAADAEVRIRDGAVRVADGAGLFPTLAVAVPEIVARRRSSESGRVALDGRLEVAGAGRLLLQGSVGGGAAPEISLRALDDNDLLQVLPARWRPSGSASLSVGALAVAWPPTLRAGPFALRDVDMALPGLGHWRLRHLQAVTLTVGPSRTGVQVRLDAARAELGGRLATATIDVESLEAFVGWDGVVTGAVVLRDPDGGRLRLDLQRSGAGVLDVAIAAERYRFDDAARLVPVDAPLRPVRGLVDGRVALARPQRDGPVTGSAAVVLEDATLRAPLLASTPLAGLALSVDADLWLDAPRRTLRVPRAEVGVGTVRVSLTGSALVDGSRLAVEVDARSATAPAQAMLDALPAGFAPALAGFVLSGEAAFAGTLSFDTTRIEAARIGFAIEDHGVQVERFGPAAPIDALTTDEFSVRVSTFEGVERTLGPAEPGWVALADVAESLPRSVVAAEDDGFLRHAGFDWRGIHAALVANLEAGTVVRGGSTITQQVAKNLYLDHDRTVARKAQEAFLTWLLERYVPKERILEIYVNLAHWGPGVYGIGDASEAYFAHVPANLTLRESVFLAAILPNPEVFGQQYAEGVLAPSRQQKMWNVLANLHRAGYLTDAELAQHRALVDRGEVSAARRPVFALDAAAVGRGE